MGVVLNISFQMVLITEVTKKTVEEMEKETIKEGAYITGLYHTSVHLIDY